MAGLLKNAVVILVLITVAKRFIAADEDTATEAPTTSALQEASQEPEETTRRDDQFGERYPVELCNPFYKFWTNHSLVWTTRTSSSCESCKRQKFEYLNETGVMLKTMWNNPNNGQLISKDMYWEFRPNGSIAHYYKNSKGKDLFVVDEELIFENVNKT
ncbi:uncharacterized protein LOC125947273 [Dermacentor silvarum]|uniref:uncharacterized protein LOC125947273 n=1 Tax=Dermacentor silvarum TaxID=543639 RepID=UPI0021016BCB|nr:uncharacterized protein LOC125947273 [Dermacentor silvarum]